MTPRSIISLTSQSRYISNITKMRIFLPTFSKQEYKEAWKRVGLFPMYIKTMLSPAVRTEHKTTV